MKVIGLIGGMSWESSVEYNRLINQKIRERLGGLNSAKILMYSVNHHEINQLEHQHQWEKVLEIMIESARRLEKGGADFILICCNVMHKMADPIQSAIGIPLIHIADAAADAVKEIGLKTVGELINDVIFSQLAYGKIVEESRQRILDIIKRLKIEGCQGVILGCTELPLLIGQEERILPLFDTLKLHADRAVNLALGNWR